MKVLMIGQLPKEIGGNYTTGAANVVYELSKRSCDNVKFFVYGTNIASSVANKHSDYPNQFMGYRLKPVQMLFRALCHPIDTIKHLHHYKSVDHQNVFRLTFYEDNIRDAIKSVSPDLVHVHSISNLSSVKNALRDSRIPVFLTLHGIFWRGNLTDRRNRDKYLGNIDLADYYSGLTRESLVEYENYLRVPKNQVSLIPNGVDSNKFYFSEEERANIRNKYGVCSNTKVLITVASVQERKGQFAIVRLLEKNYSMNYQYWIVGTGPDVDTIFTYVTEHGLQNRIKLLGIKTSCELYKYYSAADVYIHASSMEGQALCEIEAYACGLKILVNDKIKNTVVGDITDDSLYKVFDFDNGLTNDIQDWITESTGVRESRKQFDWSKIAQLYIRWYNKLCKSLDY